MELTEEGRKAAADVLNRHILLKGFLIRLGVSEAIADKDACSMEHILSAETLSTIEDFMKRGNEGAVAKKANALKAKKGK